MISLMGINSMMHHQNSSSSSTLAPANLDEHTATAQPNSAVAAAVGGSTVNSFAVTPPSSSPKSFIYNTTATSHSSALKRRHFHDDSNIGNDYDNSKLINGNEYLDSVNFRNEEKLFTLREKKKSSRTNSPDLKQSSFFSEETLAADHSPSRKSPKCKKAGQSPSAESTVPNTIANNSGVENFLEAQKAFQKITSQLSGFNLRNPFHLSTISPFIAALQHQQNFQQQLFSAQNSDENSTAAGFCERDAGILGSAIPSSAYLGTLPFNPANRLAASENRGGENGRTANDTAVSTSVAIRGTGSTASSARSRASPAENILFSGDEEDEELMYRRVGVEPEDLSLGRERRDNDETGSTAPSNWSWEEQFKQLYELSNDPERREWLNDWLSFMHRIGKPVTRIPIMAKQVLDLYELYRLVVQHGGLVEIINKKLWREITKGLNLPNSITSAAFTLRTQYQKYLYDYECNHENLSCLADLQAAIEGNRREGRRTNPADGPNSNGHTPSQMAHANISRTPHTPANDTNDVRRNSSNSAAAAMASVFPYSLAPHSMAAFFGKQMNLPLPFGVDKEDMATEFGNAFTNSQNTLPSLAQFELLQKAALGAAVAASNGNLAFGSHNKNNNNSNSIQAASNGNYCNGEAIAGSGRNSATSPGDSENDGYGSIAPAKKSRRTLHENNFESNLNFGNVNESIFKNSPTTRMKLTSSQSGCGESSMVVSMEVNGTMYQGVLFATDSSPQNTKNEPKAQRNPPRPLSNTVTSPRPSSNAAVNSMIADRIEAK